MEIFTKGKGEIIKVIDKLKGAMNAQKQKLDQQIIDVKRIEVEFRKKELKLLGKFEDKIDANSKKLDTIILEIKKIKGGN